MALDVEVPDPPPLRGPQSHGEYAAIDMDDQQPEDDYRREELAGILEAGAWADAFDEWSAHTLISDDEFEALVALGLIEGLDFYWDPATGEAGYHVPPMEGDTLDEFDDPDGVEGALDSLGRVVSETLENDYLLREEDPFGFFDGGDTDDGRPDG